MQVSVAGVKLRDNYARFPGTAALWSVVAFNGVTAASMVQVLPYRHRLKDLNEALGQDKRFQRDKQRVGNRQGRGWSGFRLAK